MAIYILIMLGLCALLILVVLIERRLNSHSSDKKRIPFQNTKKSFLFGLFGSSKSKGTHPFKVWVEQNMISPEYEGIRFWLLNLRSEEMDGFIVHLHEFCVDVNINLEAVVKGAFDEDEALKPLTHGLIIHYCQACWHAVQAQSKLKFFALYQELINNPKKNEQTIQSLFAALVSQNLVSPLPPNLFLADGNERQDHILSTIRDVANRDRATFNSVLARTVTD